MAVRRIQVAVAAVFAAALLPALAHAAPPAGVTAIALDGKVELAWQPATGAGSYTVYRGLTPLTVTTAITPPGGVVAPGFSDTGAVNGTVYYYAVRAVISGAESGDSLIAQAAPAARSCVTGNPVAVENCFPGSTAWNSPTAPVLSLGGIEAFATASSVARGGAVDIKAQTAVTTTANLEIYRSGWYGGTGGRLVSVVRKIPVGTRPACTTDTTTGLYSCSGWTPSATVTTTASWPSGVYLLRLVRDDNGASYVFPLVVRDEASHADLLYGVPFTTYQAYNNVGGKSLYGYNSSGGVKAVKVSFDRPWVQPRDTTIPNWYQRADYPLVSWLERSGYDVAYISDDDLETNAGLALGHRAFVSGAHDEYWSSGMRSAVQAARDAGEGLFFSGANAVYWRIRFENGGRTEVCYKTTEGGAVDPVSPTTLWRDPAGAKQPENALVGQQYIGDKDGVFFPLVVSAAEGADRLWRYTGLDAPATGTSTSVGTQLVGWEWDRRDTGNGAEPAGVKTVATSSATGNVLQGPSGGYASGTTSVHVTKYVAASGALVVATGTNHWGRGLGRTADGSGEPDRRIQQATTNLLADMGVQPSTPAGDITLDSATAPRVGSTSPADAETNVVPTVAVKAVFSRALDATTITATSFTLKRPDGSTVAATVAYDAATTTATLTPGAALAFSTQYTARVDTTVKASDGTPLQSPASWIFTTKANTSPVRVNAGGPAYTATDGRTFLADSYASGGSTFAVTSAISGTSDPALYQNERWGSFSYAIPVVNGTYDVKLHFVELYYTSGSCVGKRVFSLDVLDTATSPDIANLDVCAAAGGASTALVRTVYGVQVSDGFLDLKSIYGAADDPELAAVEVVPSSGPPPAPTVTQTTPAAGATGIATSVKPTATFSRTMDAATITNASFTLKDAAGATVAASVAYEATSLTATLTPAASLALSTTYTASLSTAIKAGDGQALASAVTWSFTTAASLVTGSTVRVNSGGGAYTSASGAAYAADQYFTGGSTFSSAAAIAGTTDPALYQNERWGNFSYAIPVTNGTYDVTFHFVELYYTSGGCIGKRVFSIDIGDTPTSPDVANLDVCAAAGGANRAYARTVTGVSVGDGFLNVQSVYGSADDPELAAIEVVPSGAPAPTPPDPAQVGQWGGVLQWPLVTVHASLLPTGNVLVWDGFADAPNSERIWNPGTGAFLPVPYGVNIFCSGHINLPDGRVFIAGGHQAADVGIPDTTIYDPANQTWTAAATMSVSRWYPTATLLGNGQVFVFAGDNIVQDRLGQPHPYEDASVNSLPSVYDPPTNTWKDLTGAVRTSPLYPYLFQLSDGRIVDAGPDTQSRILDPATWTWSNLAVSSFDGMSAVMYRPDKILKVGTWADPDFFGAKAYSAAPNAAVLDLTKPAPAWSATASMAYARAYNNLTMLPDGTVLASGGMTGSDGIDLSKAVLPAEIWDPATGKWTTVASEQIGREYHSTALLLADGRVLMAGGGQLPGTAAVNQPNAEIYSPPYLFKGSRPTISAAPSTLQYGAAFTVSTPDAASIASVALVRTPSVTHAFDENQRYVPLSFTAGSGSLTVTAPAGSNTAPPGHYMLFVVNGNGVPSVASIVRFPAPWEDTVAPSAPTNLTAVGGVGKVSLSWTASTDNVGVTRYAVYRSTTSGFVAGAANRIGYAPGTTYTDSVAAGTYFYVIRAEDAAGNLSPSSLEGSATATADVTAPTVSVTAPAGGTTVTGTVSVSASATDDVGVVGVQLKLDGVNLGAEDTTAPYGISWDTATATNGAHTLTAVARDAAGNVGTSAPVTVTVSNTATPAGLVAAYSFDAGSGSTVADLSGNGNTGTISNATWTTAGHTGAALSFNGTSALVSVPNSASLALSAASTLEAWVNPTALGTVWRTAVMKEQPPGNLAYALYANTETTRPSGHVFTNGVEAILKGPAALSLSTWAHLAATYDGATLRLYVNGTQVASKAVSGPIAQTSGALRIGGNTIWGEWFKGTIDDVRVYNRALTAAEVSSDLATPVR